MKFTSFPKIEVEVEVTKEELKELIKKSNSKTLYTTDTDEVFNTSPQLYHVKLCLRDVSELGMNELNEIIRKCL